LITVFYIRFASNEASISQEEDTMMPWRSTLVRTLGMVTFIWIASLALPYSAQAGGVHVSIGVGVPVVVAPAPVVVQPAPVVVPQPVIVQRAPVIVAEPPVVMAEPRVVYGYPSYRRYYRHWKHHHHQED
jgi:hypothetical protein